MSARIAIINYGMGNLRSVENALLKVGASPKIVTKPSEVTDVEGLVLPGVGALEDCVDGLRASNFDDFIAGWIQEDRPFMGVCLGLQALFDVSEERHVKGLGIFPGKVVRFVSQPGFKIPHMGWNTVALNTQNNWVNDQVDGDFCYYVHSYYVEPGPHTIATTTYAGIEYAAMLRKDNFYAAQFHPEKSAKVGEQIIRDFLSVSN